MLSINTKQNTKLVEVDGYGFTVRKPGAGESLTMQKARREISNMGDVEGMSDSQKQQFEDLYLEVLDICLSLFSSDDPKAVKHIQTLDAEILLDVIAQVFNTEAQTDAAVQAS